MIAKGATMGTTTHSHKEHATAVAPFHSHFFESLHKEQWQEVRLGEVTKTANTGLDAIKRAPIVNYRTSLKCLRIQDISQNKCYQDWGFTEVSQQDFFKFQLKKKDILIARTGASVGVKKIIEEDLQAVFNNGLIRIRTSEKIKSKFLYYILSTSKYDGFIEGISGGTSTQPNIQIQSLLDFNFPLPPLKVQQQIAEILSSFDDKIDLLHRQNKTLESLALTLFRHTFIDNPNRNEWEMGKLGDWLIETIGGDWGKEKPINDFQEKVFCIRGTDIADLNKGLADKTPIRYIKKNKLSMLEPKEGDIIFEISGGTETQSTGRCVFVNQQVKTLFEYPIVFSNFCRLLRVKKKEYSYFLYLYLQHLYYNDEFFALENGTSGIKNLNYKALFYELEYKMPSKIQVIEFHEKVKIYFDKINASKKQIQNLQSMCDMLLAKILI